MTKEEIIEVAIQVGIKRRTDEFYSEFCDGVYFDDFINFAKLIAEKERDDLCKYFKELEDKTKSSKDKMYLSGVQFAIRAREQDAKT